MAGNNESIASMRVWFMKYRVDLVEQLLIKIDKGGGGRAGTQSSTVNILNPSDLRKKDGSWDKMNRQSSVQSHCRAHSSLHR